MLPTPSPPVVLGGLVVAYVYWRVFFQRPYPNEPPGLSYWIPFIGHAWEFISDADRLSARVLSYLSTRKAGDPKIATAHLGGRSLYVVLDGPLAGDVYKRSRDFTFDPFSLMATRACGATAADMRVIEEGSKGSSLRTSKQNGKRNVMQELHVMLPEELGSEALEAMTQQFTRILRQRLRLSVQELSLSDGQQNIDLVEFMKQVLTLASSETLFGTRFVERWESLYKDYWAFDAKMPSLVLGLPSWMNPKASAARDRCLTMIQAWEREASETCPLEGVDDSQMWSETWGMRLVRRRMRIFRECGISSRGRAMGILTLMFALNSNAVPTTIWTCLHTFTNPELLKRVRDEILSCKSAGPDSSSTPIRQISQQPLCKSLLLETLRWAVNSPGLRLVTTPSTLGPYHLRANSLVYVHSRSLQMDHDVWAAPGQPSPETFWAERFLETNSDNASHDEETGDSSAHDETAPIAGALGTGNVRSSSVRMSSLRPFGGGRTICPGRHFAINEMIAGMVVLMDELDVEVDESTLARTGMPEVKLGKPGGLLPDRPLQVKVCLKDDG